MKFRGIMVFLQMVEAILVHLFLFGPCTVRLSRGSHV